MRIDVKKFVFVGMTDDKESFYKKAQQHGIIHFIDINKLKFREIPLEIQQMIRAIKILRGLPEREQEENVDQLNPDNITNSVLDLHHVQEKLNEEIRILGLEIARIRVFGDFSLEDIAFIEKEGKVKIQFFVSKSSAYLDKILPEGLLYIDSEHNLDYYIALNPQPVAYEKMIEMKIDQPYGKLHQRFVKAEKELHSVDNELKEYQKYNTFLHHALIKKYNYHSLDKAQTDVQEEINGSLFTVEGWVPENKIGELAALTKELNIYTEEIAIESHDTVPTFLENSGFGRLGEDLVNIYDTPSAADKDPSNWVFGAFILFFAFIIGDAGYGFVYLCIALFIRYKYPNLKGVGKRVLNLVTILFIGCIVWGTLTTSFFGMEIGIDNPIRKFSLVQYLAEKNADYHLAQNDTTYQEWIKKVPEMKSMTTGRELIRYHPEGGKGPSPLLNGIVNTIIFELALFIGVAHIILSFLRYSKRNWHNLGWVAFLIGAYLYFPYYLKVPSLLNFVLGINLEKGGEFGLQLMAGGIVFAWLGSIIKHGWTGIFEVTVLIQVFADVLSYLRLYALGLAGAIVSGTVNEIASGIPAFFAVLLLVTAHFINIILATMSGVIHGLRLNFLEWYHYSFEGGGKKFQPLKLLERE